MSAFVTVNPFVSLHILPYCKRNPLDPVILPVTPDVDPNLMDPLDLLGPDPWVMFPDVDPSLMDPLDLFGPASWVMFDLPLL